MYFEKTEPKFELDNQDSNRNIHIISLRVDKNTQENISNYNPENYQDIIELVELNTAYNTIFIKKAYRKRDNHIIIIQVEEKKFLEITCIPDRNFKGYIVHEIKLLKTYRKLYDNPKYSFSDEYKFEFIDDLHGRSPSSVILELSNKIEPLTPSPNPIDKNQEKQIWDKYVKAYQFLLDKKKEAFEVKVVSVDNKGNLILEKVKQNEAFEINKRLKLDITEFEFKLELNQKDPKIKFSDYQIFEEYRIEKLESILKPFYLDVNQIIHQLNYSFFITQNSHENRNRIITNLQNTFDDYDVNVSITTKGNCKDLLIEDIDFFDKILRNDNNKLKRESLRSIITFSKKSKTDLLPKLNKLTKNSSNVREGSRPPFRPFEAISFETYVVNASNARIIPEVENNIIGLKHVKTIAEFNVRIKKGDKLKPVKGFDQDRYSFKREIKNTKTDFREYKNQLQQEFPNSRISIFDSSFYFVQQDSPMSSSEGKELKRDLLGIIPPQNIDIDKQNITIEFNSKEEYEGQLSKVREKLTNYELPTNLKCNTKILFQYDQEEEQKLLFTQFENVIRNNLTLSEAKIKLVKNQYLLSFNFLESTERDKIKAEIQNISKEFDGKLSYNVKNSEGQTIVFLNKDHVSEKDDEKQFYQNLRDADFSFETKELFLKNNKKEQELNDLNDEMTRIVANRESIPDSEWSAKKDKQRKLNSYQYKRWRNNKKSLGSCFYAGYDRRTGKNRIIINPTKNSYIQDLLHKILVVKPNFWGEENIIQRMGVAMNKIMRPNKRVGFSVNRNIENYLFDPSFAGSIPDDVLQKESYEYKSFSENRIEKHLNPKQEKAILKALATDDLMLLQGPPGTGKTTAISEMIWQIICSNQKTKVLVSSQTNLAVDNALDRLPATGVVRPLRVGGSRIKVFTKDRDGNDIFDDIKTKEKKIKYAERFEEGFKYAKVVLEIWQNEEVGSNFEIDTNSNIVTDWFKRIRKKVERNKEVHPKFSKVLDKWANNFNSPKQKVKKLFTEQYLEWINIVAATCMECGTKDFSEEFEHGFEYVIVDEASKATPPELILPLTYGHKSIIIGDHKQLPPMIEERKIEEALKDVGGEQLVQQMGEDVFKVSQFEKLFEQAKLSNPSIITELDTQYRMHEDIMSVINQFYQDIENENGEKGLICGLDKEEMNKPFDAKDENGQLYKASRDHGLSMGHFLNPETHVIWVDVKGAETKRGTTYYNEGEINAIGKILKGIKKSERYNSFQELWQKEEDREIGVITFYGAQLKELRNFAERKRGSDGRWKNYYDGIPIRIDTVDKFQGMERNILIVSTVRSNNQEREEQKGSVKPNRSLGFATDPKRINVAFSRARRLLIIVGNKDHFTRNPLYKEVIKIIDAKGLVIPSNLI